MKATILNGFQAGTPGAGPSVKNISIRRLGEKGYTIRVFDLAAMNIRPCLACFDCWTKHPGVCAVKDDQEQVIMASAETDLFVWLTPVVFGGYSPELKKSLDRMLPLLLPFFVKVEGERHHPLRYYKKASLLVVGVTGNPDEESAAIFGRLVRRNVLNLWSPAWETVLIDGSTSEKDIDFSIASAIDRLEAV